MGRGLYAVFAFSFAALTNPYGSSGQARAAVARDSAGVRIVAQRPSPPVSLAGSRAHFRVDGAEAGREPFFRIRGVIPLADGFVVANAGNSELRFYGADGSPRAVAGRRGGGPGEFQGLSWIQRLGDSVAAYDARLSRISVWSPRGAHLRDAPVKIVRGESPAGALAVTAPAVLGVLPDDAMLFVGSVRLIPQGQGLQRAVGRLIRTKPGSERRDTLTQMAVMDYQPAAGGGGPPTRLLAFPRMLAWSIGDAGFVVSDGAAYRIDQYSSTGRQIASIRVDRTPVAVTARDREAWLAKQTGDRPPEPVFPSVFPAYSALWYDSAGRLWAEVFRSPAAQSGTWDVFDRAGRLLATIEAPSALRLIAADARRVYGIHTDDLDVQTIEAFDAPAVITRR